MSRRYNAAVIVARKDSASQINDFDVRIRRYQVGLSGGRLCFVHGRTFRSYGLGARARVGEKQVLGF